MEPRSLKYVSAACKAELRQGFGETLVTRICTDSRKAQPGDLFFALGGERFDGHDFLVEVSQKGAAAVVVNRAKTIPAELRCAVLAAENTRAALGRLASRYRTEFEVPMVAVSGSNGKTTTKELVASVLNEKLSTLSSEASFNNDIGVPMTLLRLEENHSAAVLEAGTNHPGELAPLLQMINPELGVLTSVGREHLEFFSDLAGVAEEEGWLAELLPPNGKLFVNGDSECIPEITRRSKAAVVRVGIQPHNDWRATNVRTTEAGVVFQAISPTTEFSGEYHVSLLGRHQAVNALLAVAVGAELGLDPEQARRGLTKCPTPRMRLQMWERNGVRILDDSYNSNADSTLAALQTLHDLPNGGRRIAILGDMAELGSQTVVAHAEIGRCAAQLGLSHLLAVGHWARQTAEAARAAGLKETTEFADVPAAAKAAKELVRPGDLVLVKGSRSAGLERLTAALRE